MLSSEPLQLSKVQGLSDEESIQRANYAGAFKATRQETRGSATKTELEAFIKRLNHIRNVRIWNKRDY